MKTTIERIMRHFEHTPYQPCCGEGFIGAEEREINGGKARREQNGGKVRREQNGGKARREQKRSVGSAWITHILPIT